MRALASSTAIRGPPRALNSSASHGASVRSSGVRTSRAVSSRSGIAEMRTVN
jgi:hypothetical protein